MTEVKTAEPAAPAGSGGDLKTALMGFVSELKGFRAEIETKLNEQENRMTMLDRKTAFRGRAPLATEANAEAPHLKAFNAYVRHGDDSALRGLSLEEKGLSVASDGGFLAAPQIAEQVQGALNTTASLRAVAKVVTVESGAYEVLVDKGGMGTAWADELSVAETDAPVVERITVPVHELSAMPKASQRLLDDAAFDVDAWLAERIAEKFARAEAAAFINGTGINQPTGLLMAATAPQGSEVFGQIGYVISGDGAGLGAQGGDALINLVYALPAQHRANASFVMNSKTAAEVRRLKDADGRYLWADSLSAGQPAMLLGYPVLIVEDMPDIGFDTTAIAFGDFNAAYTIVERPELRVLRDPFSAKPHVLFYATKRVGGGITDTRAVKFLKIAA